MKKSIIFFFFLLGVTTLFALDRVPEFKPYLERLPASVLRSGEYLQNDELLDETGAWTPAKSTWEERSKKILMTLGNVSQQALTELATVINQDAAILSANMHKGLEVDGIYSCIGGYGAMGFALFPSDAGSPIGVARVGKGHVIFVGHDGIFSHVLNGNKSVHQFFKNVAKMKDNDARFGIAAHMNEDQIEDFSKKLGETATVLNTQTLSETNIYLVQGIGRLDNLNYANVMEQVTNKGAILVLANTFWAGREAVNQFPLKDLVEKTGLIFSGSMNPIEAKNLTLDFWPYTNGFYFANSYNRLTAPTRIQSVLANSVSNSLSSMMHVDYAKVKPIIERLAYSMALPMITKKAPLRSKEDPIKALIARLQGDLLKMEQLTDIVHPCSTDWPGSVPTDAQRIKRSLIVDLLAPDKLHAYCDRPTWIMTGLYAPAGQPITVTIPEQMVGRGFQAQIGTHVDVNYGWHDNWTRFPDIVKTVKLDSTSTTFSSAFGGIVVLLSPPGTGRETQIVTISGAVKTPFYVYGRTSLERWEENKKGLGAWGYIQTPNVIVFANAEHLRRNNDPLEVAEHWYNVLNWFDRINGMENLRKRPEMVSSERQIIVGYGHSGYPGVMCYDDDDILVSPRIIKNGDWGFYHELGHAYQAALYTRTRLANHAEIDVNIYPYVAYEMIHGHLNPLHYKAPHSTANRKILAKDWERFTKHPIAERNFNTTPDRGAIQYLFYWELRGAFGWGLFERAYRKIYTDIDNKTTLNTKGLSHQARLLKLFSLESGHNLLPYYQSFGLHMYLDKLLDDKEILALPEWHGNRSPLPIESVKIQITENTNPTHALAKFDTTDPDPDNKVYYRISEGNELGAFELDAVTGELFLVKPLDYEKSKKITLKIEAFDTAFLPKAAQATCEIEIKNVQEPVDLKAGNYFWFDDARVGDVIGKIDAVFDDGCTGRFEVTANDYLKVDSQTGEIKVIALQKNLRIKLPVFYELEVKCIQLRNKREDLPQVVRIRIFPEMKKGCLVQEHSFIPTESAMAHLQKEKLVKPEKTAVFPKFQWDGNQKSNIFMNVSTLYFAPETGQYTFYVASDDAAELRFKPLFSNEEAERIAYVTYFSAPLDFKRFLEQKSKTIHLKKGEIIILSLNYIQLSGGAHFAVGVKTPSSNEIKVIDDGIVVDPKMQYFLNLQK